MGITLNFTFNASLVSVPELLGEYEKKGFWTISETLDYIDSLPDDPIFKTTLCRTGGTLPLLSESDGYMYFIDRNDGTCSFDCLEFIRYLNFLKSLPTWAEYKSHSPLFDLDAEALVKPYMEGKLRTAGINGIYEID